MRSGLFICPLCSHDLVATPDGRCLRCGLGHSFDIARQGYVSLVSGASSRPTGDTAAMTRARASFLASGLYSPIADALAAMIAEHCSQVEAPGTQPRHRSPRPLMADLGGGTGWYSARLLDRLPILDGVLLDVSSAAAKIAARAHPRLSVATADLWRSIPLPDASCMIALVVFAPRNPTEIGRILTPGGVCVVVSPNPDHLRELRDTFPMLGIDPDKEHRLADQFAGFGVEPSREVRRQARFTSDDLANVIAMGPTAFHTSPADIAAMAARVGELNVTVSVTIHCFTRP